MKVQSDEGQAIQRSGQMMVWSDKGWVRQRLGRIEIDFVYNYKVEMSSPCRHNGLKISDCGISELDSKPRLGILLSLSLALMKYI
jgi:hypothetical protein